MAERDYALEMWRLLDPDAHLIDSKQLLDRVVCVKSGNHYILRRGLHVLLELGLLSYIIFFSVFSYPRPHTLCLSIFIETYPYT